MRKKETQTTVFLWVAFIIAFFIAGCVIHSTTYDNQSDKPSKGQPAKVNPQKNNEDKKTDKKDIQEDKNRNDENEIKDKDKDKDKNKDQDKDKDKDQEPIANMPNPASAHCEKMGGKLEMQKNEKGEFGVCVFKDGSRCEEWRFFRKQCKKGKCHEITGICEEPSANIANPASTNCLKMGGKLEMQKNEKGEFGVCIFEDGSRCEEWKFFRKQCRKGQCHSNDGICGADAK